MKNFSKSKLKVTRAFNNSETLELSWNIEPNRIEFFQYFDFFRVRFDRTDLKKTSDY